MVTVDHDGLFIFVETSFAGSFHDVRFLRSTDISIRWKHFFSNDPDSVDPVEYGLNHFILRRIDERLLPNVDNGPIIRAFNKHHAGYQIAVEWSIGGLKKRFPKFLETCSNLRDRFGLLFRSSANLPNFIHRRRRNLNFEDLGLRPPEKVESKGKVY